MNLRRTAFPFNVVFKREDVAKDAHAGKDYDFITWYDPVSTDHAVPCC
jgi:hypothetical protein